MTLGDKHGAEIDLADLTTTTAPSGGGAPGKSTPTGRLARGLVLRVTDPAVAHALGTALAGRRIQRVARDDNGVAPGADAAVERAAASSGAPLPSPVRDRFETSTGADLSSVRVHTGADSAAAAHAVGAKAYTVGQDIHFAEGRYQPDDPFGMHLLAHEVAHTVQQQGGAVQRQHQLEVSRPADALEHEADRAADAMVAGARSPALATAAPTVHRFAEDNHRMATVDGLHDTFSAEEIGEIYAANWERDFSQSHPKIGNVVLAWTAVKNAARASGGNPGAASGGFRGALDDLLSTPPKELVDLAGKTSLDGYQSWHHFDQPEDKKVRADADARWAGQRNGLSGYILDTRAYIKDQLVAAVDVYREMADTGKVSDHVPDVWDGVDRPDGYVAPDVTRDGDTVKTRFGEGYDDSSVKSRDPVREESEQIAKAHGAKSSALDGDGRWRLVGQHLGRAMHAFEDFWAHSNWTDLAAKQLANPDGRSQEERNADLETGVFDMSAKIHTLGHKITGLAAGLQRDQALVQKAFGRSGASNKLSRPDPKVEAAIDLFGGQFGRMFNENTPDKRVFEPLDRRTKNFVTEGTSLLESGAALYGLYKTGYIKAEDIVCNPSLLAALQAKGQSMIEEADEASDEHSHGKIAKDQHEHGKEHELAMKLAGAANAKVFGPLRKIMDMRDPVAAAKAVEDQLALIDGMLQAPGPGHPLWSTMAP